MIILNLPWPPRALSPNVRTHYMAVARFKRQYRRDCYYATLSGGAKACGPQILSFVFRPPHNRRYDKDNLIAQMKAGIDGIADALHIDDQHFHIGDVDIGPCMPGGEVQVFISDYQERSND